jgi:hypothetical protein
MKTQDSLNPHLQFPQSTLIPKKHRSQFGMQAVLLFEKAIDEANRGLVYSAADTARDALVLSKYTSVYIQPYIHGLLAQLLLDLKRHGAAAFHAEMAIARLNSRQQDYSTDNAYYTELLRIIKADSKIVREQRASESPRANS